MGSIDMLKMNTISGTILDIWQVFTVVIMINLQARRSMFGNK